MKLKRFPHFKVKHAGSLKIGGAFDIGALLKSIMDAISMGFRSIGPTITDAAMDLNPYIARDPGRSRPLAERYGLFSS